MQKPVNEDLAICIPTYNRADKLRDGLEHLIPLVSQHNIPVYISDNCSLDGTEGIVREWQAKYPHLYYSRNSENLGPDRNFEIVLKQPSTRFAWLLSDDDRLCDGSLGRAMEIIREDAYDLIIFNGGELDPSKPFAGRVRDLPPGAYTDRNDLLADLGWHMTYISCLLFGRKLREGGNFARYYNSSLLQVGVIFDYFAGRDPLVYWESAPGVYGVPEGWPAWYSRTFEIWVESWCRVIGELSSTYSAEAKRTCIMAHGIKSGLFANLSTFKRLRRMGYYNLDVYRRYRDQFPLVTDIPLPILFCCTIWPNIAKSLHFCYRLLA